MRAVKAALDPAGICNPNVLLPHRDLTLTERFPSFRHLTSRCEKPHPRGEISWWGRAGGEQLDEGFEARMSNRGAG